MLTSLRNWSDRLLGRGSAAITVPVMDGALKPNRQLDDATVVAEIAGIDDLACDGQQLWISAGPRLLRLQEGQPVLVREFNVNITALAAQAKGTLAVALGGTQVQLLHTQADGSLSDGPVLQSLEGQPLHSVNALAFEADGAVLLSDGSQRRSTDQWCHDLMELGHSGRVARWQPATGAVQSLASGLHHAFGVLPLGGQALYSESWKHRVTPASGAGKGKGALVAELPGYPSRMSAAAGGGFWLSCFVCRSQLVEFVLREPAYRKRMLQEIDPRYWIAPALSSGHSFLEPLQGAGVKQMGMLKPWAPPRSYGLVLRVAADGRILSSLHSQVDGRHHGVTAVVEWGGALWVASKGAGRLLRIDLNKAEART
ncbi:strictosidine synthase [Limnohabitans sp. T6-20]|uniref:strictosidine synthase n=1 Tax=Limnohabitans sp. T6-20 TaxID=1100725 RepID=UPI000D3666C8|nr:strictosidine synthase [Limnohabitans sp. T6-20]PUE12369.1 strictosidine synthase [Limnohabitans sp. T6-20]